MNKYFLTSNNAINLLTQVIRYMIPLGNHISRYYLPLAVSMAIDQNNVLDV